MKNFLDKWKLYENNNKEDVLYEVSDEELESIADWVGDFPEDKLSFRQMFDGKKRVMLPFGVPESDDLNTPFGRMMNYIESAGGKVDFSDGTLSQEVSSEKSDKKQVRKTRIGKWFNKVASMREKEVKMASEWRAKSRAGEDVGSLGLEWDRLSKKIKKEYGNAISTAHPDDLKAMSEFWATKSEFYRQNPDAANEGNDKYKIIISRAPIDVLRMSDFDDLNSCHSPDGSHFKCAVAEAKGHGLVAFIVDAEQWDEFSKSGANLQDNEIFKDRMRDINGISPRSRVRLRKFSYLNPTTNVREEIAVPEMRVYGKRFPGFVDKVTEWARAAQPEFIKLKEEGEYPNIEEMTRYGGSYEDNYDSALLNNFFEEKVFPNSENAYGDKGDEEEDETEQMRAAITEVENRAAAAYVNGGFVDGEVHDDGNGPYVTMSGGIILKIPMDEMVSVPNEDLSDEIGHLIGNLDVEEVSFTNNYSRTDMTIVININTDAYHGGAGGFEDFARDIDDELDTGADGILEGIKEILRRNGYMEALSSDEYKEWHTELEDLDIEYENFSVDIDDQEILIVSKEERDARLDISDQVDILSHYSPARGQAHTQVYNMARRAAQEIRRNIADDLQQKTKNQLAQLELPGIDPAKEVEKIFGTRAFEINVGFADTPERGMTNDTSLSVELRVQMLAEDSDDADIAKIFMDWLDENYDLVMSHILKELEKKIAAAIRTHALENERTTEVKSQIDAVDKLIKETEPFQNYAKAQNKSTKTALLTKGGNKHKAKPYTIKISTKRAKSAPPDSGS